MVYPNGIILLGARAITSAIGIILIIIGQWHADRTWDDTILIEGPQQQGNHDVDSDSSDNDKRNQKNSSSNNHDGTEVSDTASEIMKSTYEHLDTTYRAMTDPNGVEYHRLHKLLTGPSGFSLCVAILGYIVLCISFLLECHMIPNTWHISFLNIFIVFVFIILAIIQTMILPLAIRNRTVHHHIHFFTFATFCGYVLLGFLLVLDRNESPIWLPLTGSIAIAIAPNLLWYCRRRGDTYDRVALLTLRPVLFNIGGPLLVTGWFMVWVAMNYISEEYPNQRHLPIYWTSRTAVAFEGAISIFAAYWATGYAHDEHDDPEQVAAIEVLSRSDNINRTPRPLKAFMFGRILETRIFFVITWFMISVAIFLPSFEVGGRFWKILLFLSLLAQGFATGVQHVLGIRAGDEGKLQKWTRVVESLFILIVFLVFITTGYVAGLFTLFGVILMGCGWKLLQLDRKRGEYWIQTKTINPKWTVYSYGVLVFPFGILLFAWGLSIP